jgi:hypothetical protein
VALTEASTSGLPVEADVLATLGRSGGPAQASCSGAVPGTAAVWASWTRELEGNPPPPATRERVDWILVHPLAALSLAIR